MQTQPSTQRQAIAFFVTPHGLGHAARAAAVMAAMQEQSPGAAIDLFTAAPEAFFRQSVRAGLRYHPMLTDVGLVQDTPLHADLPATVARLDAFLPFDPALVRAAAAAVRHAGCGAVVCDIAPLGIAVARAAGVPSVLVENFTWDWIYGEYREEHPALSRHIAYLEDLFASADHLIQTEPVCVPKPAAFVAPPVARPLRALPEAVRAGLGVPPGAKLVLISMGGVPDRGDFLPWLRRHEDVHFAVTGTAAAASLAPHVHVLPAGSDCYHPDLVNAADAVIGKLGYSTVAEVWQAGVPFGYVRRPFWREGAALAAFVDARLAHVAFTHEEFAGGSWLEALPDLLAAPRRATAGRAGGAGRVAQRLLAILEGQPSTDSGTSAGG